MMDERPIGIAYLCGNQVVVCGIPTHYGTTEDHIPCDDPRRHNCDAMGCGRDHVIYRFPLAILDIASEAVERDQYKALCAELAGFAQERLAATVFKGRPWAVRALSLIAKAKELEGTT